MIFVVLFFKKLAQNYENSCMKKSTVNIVQNYRTIELWNQNYGTIIINSKIFN